MDHSLNTYGYLPNNLLKIVFLHDLCHSFSYFDMNLIKVINNPETLFYNYCAS